MDVRSIHPLQSAHVVSTLHALLIPVLRAWASSLLWEMGELHVCPTFTACLQAGVLAPAPHGLITAFSREAPPPQAEAGSGKVYVTQRIREHGAALWALLAARGAVVYVSGSAQKMPAGVQAAFQVSMRACMHACILYCKTHTCVRSPAIQADSLLQLLYDVCAGCDRGGSQAGLSAP